MQTKTQDTPKISYLKDNGDSKGKNSVGMHHENLCTAVTLLPARDTQMSNRITQKLEPMSTRTSVVSTPQFFVDRSSLIFRPAAVAEDMKGTKFEPGD